MNREQAAWCVPAWVIFAFVVGCESTNQASTQDSCEEDGVRYRAGETWTCSDGCNECACLGGGSIASTDLDCGCTEDDCGPVPAVPNYLCEDGETTAGPSACERQPDGVCGWTLVDCPASEDPCDFLDCTPCVNGRCLGEDEVCEPGERFDAGDGCNSCECPTSGIRAEAACTEIACGQACGSQADCSETELCDFPRDECGIFINTVMAGTCIARPGLCDEGGVGACGCEGGYRLNPCELQANGEDTMKYGGCLDSDTTSRFVCGEIRCDVQTEFCEISVSEAAGSEEPDYESSCVDLPEDCPQGICGCIGDAAVTMCYARHGYTVVTRQE